MTEHLKDLQTRNIRTKVEVGLNGVHVLGDQIRVLLGKLVRELKVKGAYFTHYYIPPQVEPHVKVGIRYEKIEDLNAVTLMLHGLCDEQTDIVTDKGRFETTLGIYQNLPYDIVVDYIICHSFDFLLEYGEELDDKSHEPHEIARFLLQHKDEIAMHLNAADIYRNEPRPTLTQNEEFWIQERFVHHLLNACKVTTESELEVWREMSRHSNGRG